MTDIVGVALDSDHAYAANSAWQQLVVLAHNLLTNFQIETGAVCQPVSRKWTVRPFLPLPPRRTPPATARLSAPNQSRTLP
jgi:hypothetical protein